TTTPTQKLRRVSALHGNSKAPATIGMSRLAADRKYFTQPTLASIPFDVSDGSRLCENPFVNWRRDARIGFVARWGE
ncbi:hypothetical protein, partial [Bradyrhizobium sp. NAS96.2]|uniref:hypothetical protein n=1 Tax=Bradyrhizobium sp. NAS96.2 TaxID=1680160 RepID=UPI001AECD354